MNGMSTKQIVSHMIRRGEIMFSKQMLINDDRSSRLGVGTGLCRQN
jgi:hypothetical protein